MPEYSNIVIKFILQLATEKRWITGILGEMAPEHEHNSL